MLNEEIIQFKSIYLFDSEFFPTEVNTFLSKSIPLANKFILL